MLALPKNNNLRSNLSGQILNTLLQFTLSRVNILMAALRVLLIIKMLLLGVLRKMARISQR